MAIHPTAIIDPNAELDPTAEIGPYVIIEGPVRIGAETRVRGHAHLSGWTEIGERCDIYPFTSVGNLPQDFHYTGERSYCRIGNEVIIREGVTIHRGTQPESATVVGDGCFLLATSHIAHNCRLGARVKVHNMAALAGHVEVDDEATISAYAAAHQFVRIGKLAFLAGQGRIGMDVPPFMIAYGDSTIVQHNVIGMRRAGYDRAALQDIRQAYRTLYRSGLTFRKAVARLAETVRTDAGRTLLAFVQLESKRGYCGSSTSHRSSRPAREDGDADTDPPNPDAGLV